MGQASAISLACLVLAAGQARPDALPLPSSLAILGIVTNAARPVERALVIALNLDTLETNQTLSGSNGAFSLPFLPAAVYRVIAVKQGFTPATTTVVPTRAEVRLALRLEDGKRSDRDINQQIWELRASLPPDVLREIDMAMAPPSSPAAATAADQIPRVRGEMVSTTGVADQMSNPSFVDTAVGVRSQMGTNWQLGFRGDLHRVGGPPDGAPSGATTAAESSAMQMELRSSPTDAYRVASTKSWWRYRNDLPAARQEANIRSHNVEWQHGEARVQVRFLAQQNLFAGNPGSDLIEVSGNAPVMQTRHSDIGVSLRVTQESLHNTTNGTFRTADLTANANLEIVPSLFLRYGMSSRLGLYGAEWAPRTGAEWKLSKNTSLVVSGLYKVNETNRQNAMPSIVVWSDESRVLPRYAYSFGFVSGHDKNNRLSAMTTMSAADSALRVMFTDGFEQFWDGLYVESGDIRRDVRVVCRKEIGKYFVIGISSIAGTATPSRNAPGAKTKSYLTGDAESTYRPSGTTLAVSYRRLRQPGPASDVEYRAERVNVRMAQALHLPLDLKLLLGVEIAHSVNSPYLLDALDPDGNSRRYLGGLAVNF